MLRVATHQASADIAPERSWGRAAWQVFRSALWAALWVYALLSFLAAFDDELGPLEGLLAFVAAASLTTFAHELGHAVAAILCGWRVIIFAAGPVGFHFANRQFALIPRSKRQEMEGFVLPAPKGPEVWTRTREALIHAGGPAASLLLAVVLFFVSAEWAGGTRGDSVDWGRLSIGFGILSLGTALHTLLPHWTSEQTTDGQRLVGILRADDTERRKVRALGWLYGLVKFQLRLRDLPLWMLEEARAEAAKGEPAVRQAVESLLVGIVLDSPPVDPQQARDMLDSFRKQYGGSAWLDSCDAYFSAIWETDPRQARERLWRGDVDDELEPLAFAAEAAVLARECDAVAARTLLQQMGEAIKKRSTFSDLTFRDIGLQSNSCL